MSAVKQLKATARERVGKGGAREVRRAGRVPAVVYGGAGGGAGEGLPISVDANEMRQLIFAGRFLTTVFELDVAGERTRVIPRDYQLDPVKDTPLHVDFLRVRAGQTIAVEVTVNFVDHDQAPGLKRGGTLNVVRYAIELNAPSDAIPTGIEASLKGLDIGDSLHISDVALPPGVTSVIDRDFTIATIATPTELGAEAEQEAAAVADAAKAESDAAKTAG